MFFGLQATWCNNPKTRSRHNSRHQQLVGKAQTYQQAEKLMDMLGKITDSKDSVQMDRGTRLKPAKKRPKFQSKSYYLTPPAAEPPTLDIGAPDTFSLQQTDTKIAAPSMNSQYPGMCSETPSLQLNFCPLVPDPVMHQRPISDSIIEHVEAAQNVLQQTDLTEIAADDLSVLEGSDGKHYAKLTNGCYVEIMNISTSTCDEQAAINEKKSTGKHLSNPDESISTEFRKLNDRLDAIEGMLTQLTNFMANFDKLMQIRHEGNVLSTIRQQDEDFSEFERLPKIDSDYSLKALEQNIANSLFADKYFRYFQITFRLNGKREGASFFRTIIRKLTMPVIFLPYSWKGNKRAALPSDSGEQSSFQRSFPEFINFIYRLVHAADFSYTRERNDQLFKDFLRYKNTEFKRFIEGYGDHRASSSRKRRQPKVSKTVEISHIPSKLQCVTFVYIFFIKLTLPI